jgi:hypothetical protein
MITLHTGNLTPETIQNTSFITSNMEPESLFEIITMILDNYSLNIDSDENDDFIVNDVNISCFSETSVIAFQVWCRENKCSAQVIHHGFKEEDIVINIETDGCLDCLHPTQNFLHNKVTLLF